MEPGSKARARRNLQFREDRPHVILDRAHADAQRLSNLLVGQPQRDGARHLELARTQRTMALRHPVQRGIGAAAFSTDEHVIVVDTCASVATLAEADHGTKLCRLGMEDDGHDFRPCALESIERQ